MLYIQTIRWEHTFEDHDFSETLIAPYHETQGKKFLI